MTASDPCCVCGGGTVVYRNYLEQPFCWLCADCPCGQVPCARTGVNDPAVAGPLAGSRVGVWTDRYFTTPTARDAYLRRIHRHTRKGARR